MSEDISPLQKALKKVVFFSLSLPIMAYAFLTTVNDIFGVDLTGRWMGERDPVGAGYVVILGSPIYIYLFFKSFYDLIKIRRNNSKLQ